jgi:hypothetical protein
VKICDGDGGLGGKWFEECLEKGGRWDGHIFLDLSVGRRASFECAV